MWKAKEFFRTPIIIYLVIVLGAPVIRLAGAKIDYCTQDVSPCICENNSNLDPSLYCIGTNITDVVEVFDRAIFREFLYFKLLEFSPQEGGIIPENLIKNSDVYQLTIQCKDSTPLQIANDSFKFQKTFTQVIELFGCNLSDTSLGFLEGFVSLFSLTMDSIPNMGLIFPNFPIRLSDMVFLTINNCLGWGQLTNTPRSMYQGSLKTLYLTYSEDMNDEAISIFMDWALHSFNTTLESIYVYGNNNLTTIPHQLQSFSRLKYLDLKENSFSLIPNHSLVFNEATIRLLLLSSSKIEEIQPGAFQGNFANSIVDLQSNYLTTIESAVFMDILFAGATIDVKDNPIDCSGIPCHLAWIFNENLIGQVSNAQCANGTFIKELDPNVFIECKVLLTTEYNSYSTETSNKHETFQDPITSSTNWLHTDMITQSITKESNLSTDDGFAFTTFTKDSSFQTLVTSEVTQKQLNVTNHTEAYSSPTTSIFPMPSNGVTQKRSFFLKKHYIMIQIAFLIIFIFC